MPPDRPRYEARTFGTRKVGCRLLSHHNQSGFVKNMLIGETARSILDIMQHTDAQRMPGLLLFIDFEKAFDSVEWDYLTASLRAFNFGPELIKWVKTFYKNVSSCILNSVFFSESFLLERGLRQGDPLSPYLLSYFFVKKNTS